MSSYEVGELFAERYVVASPPETAAGVTRFVARDNRSQREVFVEVLALREPGLVASFEHDMAEVASISDPALVPVVGSGRLEGADVYVVTEHVEAGTLSEALHLGALAAGDAMRMMARLANALAVAHESGVAHGALHPRCVLLPEFRRNRGVRTVDGARLRDLAVAVYKDQVGITSGAPRLDLMYRAPEQLSAAPSLALASDVYAWGLICAHALTGRHPLRIGGTPSTTVEIIARQAGLNVHSVLASTPLAPSLRRILERALDVDPDSRHPDATRLATELAQVGLLDGPPRRSVSRGGKPSTPSIVPNVTRFTQTSSDRSGQVRPVSRFGLSDDFDPSLDPGFDDLVTMDGEALTGFDDLVELDLAPEEAQLDSSPEAGDLISRMASSRTTQSGILLRPSELNMLHNAEPRRGKKKTIQSEAVPINARLERTRTPAAPGAPRVVEIDDQMANENLVPTVDLDDEALGQALSDLDRLDDSELIDPDATVNVADLTPHFAYDEDGNLDIGSLEKHLEPRTVDAPAVEPSPPSGDLDTVVPTPSSVDLPVAEPVFEPEPEPEPEPVEPPAPTTPASWDAPVARPRRSVLPMAVVLLLLLGGGAAAVWFFVIVPQRAQDAGDASGGDSTDPRSEGAGTPEDGDNAGAQAEAPAPDAAPAPAPCEADPATCLTEARELSEGPAYGRDDNRAAELFAQACRNGASAEGCAAYAVLLRDGRVEGDIAEAFSLVDASCTETANIEACRVAASMLATGTGVEADEGRAATLYETGCTTHGDALACVEYASMLAAGVGVSEADEDAAVELLEKTCDGTDGQPGEGAACFSLAMRRRTGDGVRKSGTRYRERLEQGCELGHPISCKEVADQYRRGKSGRSKDLEHALTLYRDACEKGYGPACTRLCYMEQNGEGADEPNHELALVHCRYGCTLGDADGCHDAAVILRSGKIESSPEGEAERLSKRACELGYPDCD